MRGVYGVPSIAQQDPLSYVGNMEKAGVNAVFVPADKETVQWFKNRGFQVYVSVKAFGGKGKCWRDFPSSRPVQADGSLVGSEGHGGICPTHSNWREKRLKYLVQLVKKLGGKDGIDGIWLDFIRYPGVWESPDPKIPDTCYCPRCLKRFQVKTGVALPIGLEGKGAADWIKGHVPYEWMTWKKAEIASFVRTVRKILDENPGGRPLKLGLFLVPWTKGERENAISYLLAQDSFELGELADVMSPMVYHRMCGKSAQWVGYMTRYYKETVPCAVWPIVEAVEAHGAWRTAHSGESDSQIPQISADREAKREKGCPLSVIGYQREEKQRRELGKVVRFAGQGGADGVLVFSFKAMRSADYTDLGDFGEEKDVDGYSLLVNGEENTEVNGDKEKRVTSHESTNNDFVAVTAKDEWGEVWVAPLEACEAGKAYVFEGEFWRYGWQNGVYPEVRIWGERFLVNTHLKVREWQPIRVNVVCPEEAGDPNFRFINRNRDTTFALRDASIKRQYRFSAEPPVPVARGFFPGRFFPIGIYGANLENLEEIKRLAINTVLLGGRGAKLKKTVESCHEVGLRYVLSVPRDPDRLKIYLDEIAAYVRPYDLAFYVNDEPGIWSFPVNRAEDINRLIKRRFPGCATCMAVVRPQVCGEYVHGADFFMLDQYPVPFMPMTWLSDCMARCAEGIAHSAESRVEGRLGAVIQAFGGERWQDVGWPRVPTAREMTCLAFLSVVYGARGIFFYTYGVIGQTEEGRDALGHAVGRLNRVYPWLVVENSEEKVHVEMISENRMDPKGRPAVQGCIKKKGKDLLMIVVNTIGTGVTATLSAEGMAHSAPRLNTPKGTPVQRGREREGHGAEGIVREVFSGEEYAIRDGRLRVRLGAYGVKCFAWRKGHGA